MGQAWWMQAQNNLSVTLGLSSSPTFSCFYQGNNMTALGAGFNNQYIEANNSGNCFFQSSYVVAWYAPPGSPSGQAGFGIQLTGGSSVVSTTGTNWQTMTTAAG